MERPNRKVSDQEAAEAFNKISMYCEDNTCSNCIFRRMIGDPKDKHLQYRCILGDYHPYVLRVVTTNEELRVVAEWEAINNEN